MNKDTAASATDSALPPKEKWPIDIIVLAIVTGHLWAITFAWYVFDLDRLLSPPLRSESDAWLLVLSGIIFLYILLTGVFAAWGFILGIPTCLLVANFSLRRYTPRPRWLISAAITAALFIALNHYGIVRYDLQAADETTAQDVRPAAVKPPPTLRDLDPSLPPVPLSEMSREDAMDALAEAARARCVAPKDPDLVDACARLREADKWQEETDKAH